jgi:hypothetical protein
VLWETSIRKLPLQNGLFDFETFLDSVVLLKSLELITEKLSKANIAFRHKLSLIFLFSLVFRIVLQRHFFRLSPVVTCSVLKVLNIPGYLPWLIDIHFLRQSRVISDILVTFFKIHFLIISFMSVSMGIFPPVK